MATRKQKPAQAAAAGPLPRPVARRHAWAIPLLSVLVALGHLGLIFAGVQLYYDRHAFPRVQGAYLLAWEALLLAWLAAGQWRSRHFRGAGLAGPVLVGGAGLGRAGLLVLRRLAGRPAPGRRRGAGLGALRPGLGHPDRARQV